MSGAGQWPKDRPDIRTVGRIFDPLNNHMAPVVRVSNTADLAALFQPVDHAGDCPRR